MTTRILDIVRIERGGAFGALGVIGVAALLAVSVLFSLFVSSMLAGGELAAFREISLLAVPLGLLSAYIVMFNERIWIFLAVVGHLVMLLGAVNAGIGAGEVAFSAVTIVGIGIWFVKEIFIFRRRVVHSGFDLLLMSFFLISTVVTLIANRLHDGDLFAYFREWISTVDLMLYFPVRKFLRGRNDVIGILVGFTIVSLGVGINSVSTYRERLAATVVDISLETLRVFSNEATVMALMLVFAIIFANARGLWQSIGAYGLFIAGWVFLIISFSRGAVVSGAAALVVSLFLLRGLHAVKLGVATVVAAVSVITVMYITNPVVAIRMWDAVESRFSTMSDVGGDLSFQSRVEEANAVLTEFVPRSPLIGYGYGSYFKFEDPIKRITVKPASFIHNGYVKPLFRFGIPVALMVYALMFYPLVRVLIDRPDRRRQPFLYATALSAVSVLVGMYPYHSTTDLFAYFPGALNFVLIWALLDWVNLRVKLESGQDIAIGGERRRRNLAPDGRFAVAPTPGGGA